MDMEAQGTRSGNVPFLGRGLLAGTQCVQNRTCEDLAPGRSERMVGRVPINY